MIDLDPCDGSKGHRPHPLRTVAHHIQPQGWGGPNVAGNRAAVCDVCHYNTHTLLELARKAGQMLTKTECRAALGLASGQPLSAYAYDLAAEGWRRWEAAGRPIQRSMTEMGLPPLPGV